MAILFLEVLLFLLQLLVEIELYRDDVHHKEAPYWEYERTVYHELTVPESERLEFIKEFVRLMSMKATAGYIRGIFVQTPREDASKAVIAFANEHGPFDRNGTFRFRIIKIDQILLKS